MFDILLWKFKRWFRVLSLWNSPLLVCYNLNCCLVFYVAVQLFFMVFSFLCKWNFSNKLHTLCKVENVEKITQCNTFLLYLFGLAQVARNRDPLGRGRLWVTKGEEGGVGRALTCLFFHYMVLNIWGIFVPLKILHMYFRLCFYLWNSEEVIN